MVELDLTKVPAPFLGPIFELGTKPVISTGFKYHSSEILLHGVKNHQAIDLDVPRGTKILAPADGFYIATYGEVLLRDEQGHPKQLTTDQAVRLNPKNTLLNSPPDKNGSIYFGSYVVQGWHQPGRYTQYAHVDWVNPAIPYNPPVEVKDEKGNPTGDLKHSNTLRDPVSTYRQPNHAAWIKKGEVIAETGMTGCGWGRRTYDFAKFDSRMRPDFRTSDYYFYTGPHLHFVVLGPRVPRTRTARAYDPFGIYGQLDVGYPIDVRSWSRRQTRAKHRPLWL